VTVKGEKIHVLMTNIDNGKTIYDYSYTIGTSEYDQVWKDGTVGFRMRAMYTKNNANSIGESYFDNFKVTTANEVDLGGTGVIPDAPTNVAELKIDTSNLTKVYENKFDKLSDLADFEQFRGTWTVFDGKLYLSAASGGQSYILYAGKDELMNLTDYVVDVDLYNLQTQGGIIARSDFANVTGATDDGFMGYQAFVSNAGKQGALGAGQPDGKWLEGNIEVSPVCLKPGMNVHLQFAVQGNTLQYVITDLDSGNVLWQWVEEHDMWSKGTFGFRFRGNVSNNLSNLNTAAFDNLVVSTIGAPVKEEKTEVKLTIGSTIAYINGEATTLDAAPINRNNRTMLPVRFLANAFGVANDGIKWDAATRTATLTNATTTIVVTIDAPTMTVNGETVALDAPAIIEQNRTYLPVRAIANALGVANENIAWDGATSTATLVK
ncbi:MAG: copper amine oxidase N-terminal domain-containing protein, partial [Clostridia bacterium]|nr:copper amine oxidase N-terminal domain-containing protein [Clostridia bacterium]